METAPKSQPEEVRLQILSKSSSPFYLVFSDPVDPEKSPTTVCVKASRLVLADTERSEWRAVLFGAPDMVWAPHPFPADGILVPSPVRGSVKHRYRCVSIESDFRGPILDPARVLGLGGIWEQG